MEARAFLLIALLGPAGLRAQSDTIPASEEEDFSQYDNLGIADE